jgi:hypothetical protein
MYLNIANISTSQFARRCLSKTRSLTRDPDGFGKTKSPVCEPGFSLNSWGG